MTFAAAMYVVRTSDVVNHHRFLCLITFCLFWRARSALYNVKIGSEGSERIPIMYVKSRSRLRTLYLFVPKSYAGLFLWGEPTLWPGRG